MSNPEDVNKAAIAAARMLQELEPGLLAELRRMDGASGAAGFWRLAARHPETIGHSHERWMPIVRILAILTAKGDPASREPLHDVRRRLGAVFCDGGDPAWPGAGAPRPILSERRLGRLMASRAQQREVLLSRAARVIAHTRQSGSGVNVCDIAWTLLDSDYERSARRLAEPYYLRLDRADREHQANLEGAKE